MKLWAIAGLGGALVCCGGESVIGGGVETGGTGAFTGGTSGDFIEGAGGTTGGAGGTTGAAPSVGGTNGESSVSSGTAGIGAGGGFPLSNFHNGCDVAATLARNCALSGCHKTGAIALASGLNLMGDDWLVPRIRDVPALHGDIYCGLEPCVPIPEECPVGVKLVDTTNWEASWLYRKITDPAGCGESMPISVVFTEEDRACLIAFVQDIAEFW
jgi:hypothetical protein